MPNTKDVDYKTLVNKTVDYNTMIEDYKTEELEERDVIKVYPYMTGLQSLEDGLEDGSHIIVNMSSAYFAKSRPSGRKIPLVDKDGNYIDNDKNIVTDPVMVDEIISNNVQYNFQYMKNDNPQENGTYIELFALGDNEIGGYKGVGTIGSIGSFPNFNGLTRDFYLEPNLQEIHFYTIGEPFDYDKYLSNKQKVYYLANTVRLYDDDLNDQMLNEDFAEHLVQEDGETLRVSDLSFVDITTLTDKYTNCTMYPVTQQFNPYNTKFTNNPFDGDNPYISEVNYYAPANVAIIDMNVDLILYKPIDNAVDKIFNSASIQSQLKSEIDINIFSWKDLFSTDRQYGEFISQYIDHLNGFLYINKYNFSHNEIIKIDLNSPDITKPIITKFANIEIGSVNGLIYVDDTTIVTFKNVFETIDFTRATVNDPWIVGVPATGELYTDWVKSGIRKVVEFSKTNWIIYRDYPKFTNPINALFNVNGLIYNNTDSFSPTVSLNIGPAADKPIGGIGNFIQLNNKYYNVNSSSLTEITDISNFVYDKANSISILQDFYQVLSSPQPGFKVLINNHSLIPISHAVTVNPTNEYDMTFNAKLRDTTTIMATPYSITDNDVSLFINWFDTNLSVAQVVVEAFNIDQSSATKTNTPLMIILKKLDPLLITDLYRVDVLLLELILFSLIDKRRDLLPISTNGAVDYRRLLGVEDIPGKISIGHSVNAILQTGVKEYSDNHIKQWAFKTGLLPQDTIFVLARQCMMILSKYINCSYSYDNSFDSIAKVYLKDYAVISTTLTAEKSTFKPANVPTSVPNPVDPSKPFSAIDFETLVLKDVQNIKFYTDSEYIPDIDVSQSKIIRTDRTFIIGEQDAELSTEEVITMPGDIEITNKNSMKNIWIIPINVNDNIYLSSNKIINPPGSRTVVLDKIPLFVPKDIKDLMINYEEYLFFDDFKKEVESAYQNPNKPYSERLKHLIERRVEEYIKKVYGNVTSTIDWKATGQNLTWSALRTLESSVIYDWEGAGSYGSNLYTPNFFGFRLNDYFSEKARDLLQGYNTWQGDGNDAKITGIIKDDDYNYREYVKLNGVRVGNGKIINGKTVDPIEAPYYVMIQTMANFLDISIDLKKMLYYNLIQHPMGNPLYTTYFNKSTSELFSPFIEFKDLTQTTAILEQKGHGGYPTATSEDWSLYLYGKHDYYLNGQYLNNLTVTINTNASFNYNTFTRPLVFNKYQWKKEIYLNWDNKQITNTTPIFVTPINSDDDFAIETIKIKSLYNDMFKLVSTESEIEIPTYNKFNNKVCEEKIKITKVV